MSPIPALDRAKLDTRPGRLADRPKGHGSTVSLCKLIRRREVLLNAWRVIRRNAERSGSRQSKRAVREFEENLPGNIDKIQRELRRGGYRFQKAFGATPPKGKGKSGKRAIVIAPVRDRVVQRAILDVICTYCDAPAIRCLLCTPTSVGGVPGRGIGHALALIENAVAAGATYVTRSDIRNFFPSLPRAQVISFLRMHISDQAFVDLFERALTVELSNRETLGEDAALFPLGEDGIAQGCPLSVLAGNIVLREFDTKMNDGDLSCIRYIDDFVVLGPDKFTVRGGLAAGLEMLNELGLQAYHPSDGTGKAWSGAATESYEFLGYKIVRGLNPPSASACDKLLSKIHGEVTEGKKWIGRCIRDQRAETQVRQCYLQSLLQIDSIIRGWAGAFQHSRSIQTLQALDNKIDRIIADFDQWFGNAIRSQPSCVQRRALGIRLLGDTPPTPLPKIVA